MPIGQLAEIDVKTPGEPPDTYTVRRIEPDALGRCWQTLDGKYLFNDHGNAVTAVRLIPDDDSQFTRCPSCERRLPNEPYDLGSGPELACDDCLWCWSVTGQALAPVVLDDLTGPALRRAHQHNMVALGYSVPRTSKRHAIPHWRRS